MGVNSAGLKSKLSSFKKVLTDLKPSVFLIEETKFKEAGHIKIGNEFMIYELVRQSANGGGGLALGCLKELNPCWVSEGNDQVEALSVDIFLKNIKIRCCVAYGPQESDNSERKDAFWEHLDKEVEEASKAGAGFILQCDGNLWAGDTVIPGDPRPQNNNGKRFQEFLERNGNLTVVNTLTQCQGLITRSRVKDGILEESVLDFFIVCSVVLPFVTKMVIDDKKYHVLTNYKQVKKTGKAVDSDHYTQYLDLDLEVLKEKPERVEIYNFKDKQSQETFRILTSETKEFTDCFEGKKPLLQKISKWRKVLKLNCSKAFKKIRIKRRSLKPLSKKLAGLIDERNQSVRNGALSTEIEQINLSIAEVEAAENREKIIKQFKYFSENPENIEMQKMWKCLKNICPKVKPVLPSAKRNFKGKIISGKKEIKILLAKEYKNRLRTRPTRHDFISTRLRRERIFKLKMRLSKYRKSAPWTMKDLESALGDLKRNKSRDFEGLVNELFKTDVIGSDLKKSFLLMFNNLRKERLIPEFMNITNITTVPKRGLKIELKNERGIFRVSVVRYILMRMIYNSKYPLIDKNISDCQMGARKGKGCKTNIWIINGIIHETLHSRKKKAILLQIYDYAQMFDSINLQEALSDIYDYGLDDDNLSLIHEANKKVQMAVKTSGGLTDRQIIENSVLQGETWGSLLASVQVDSIAKDIVDADLGYNYKDDLPISILGLVDDLIGVTEAGHKAQQMNVLLNVKSAEKCLQFGVKKCKTMLIGKKPEEVINNALFVDGWKEDYVENKETGEMDLVEQYIGDVELEQVKEQKYLGFVISSEGNNLANIKAMEQKSHGVIRSTINKLDSLNLRQYYFESAFILMNAILRPSILYAAECYYNITEGQLRRIERIEEKYLRKVFKTSRSCPIIQMYLEAGQWPARFELQKMRCLFLKQILNQDENSQVVRFFYLQLNQPVRNDWVSTCMEDLKKLEIFLAIDDLKNMNDVKFKKLVKSRIKENAFKYLLKRRGSKGQGIEYSGLEMSEYLLPHNDKVNLDDKQKMFSLKNGMVQIPSNFGKPEEKCFCGERENMPHIYSCQMLNEKQPEIPFEKLNNGSISDQNRIYQRFENNMKIRNQIKEMMEEANKNKQKNIPPCDLVFDPLNCT